MRRTLVFLITFLLAAGGSLAYVYNRPALYRSSATLLTVAQTAIDAAVSSDATRDIQHVTIQRQILMGEDLLNETLEQLDQSENVGQSLDGKLFLAALTSSELRKILTVEILQGTNLVELAATSYYADTLEPLINTWVDVYLERRDKEFKQASFQTTEVIHAELNGLETKILIKRKELEEFRADNDITSLGRENIYENQTLAQFKGLNESLVVANADAVQTKARLTAIKRAIAEGKAVFPRDALTEMQELELRLQELQEMLTEFDKKYTREYLALNPSLNVLPQQIKELQEVLLAKRSYGTNLVLSKAEQDYRTARRSLRELQRQITANKKKAANFSSKFSVQESLLSDLDGLEGLQRTAQERLAQIEAKQAEKFPQVNVIQRAFSPQRPFSPDYTRDAFIALASSLLFSLFSVWLVEFLTRKEVHTSTISVTGTGTHAYKDMSSDLISQHQKGNAQLDKNSVQALAYEEEVLQVVDPEEPKRLRKLELDEVDTLLEASDIRAKQLITLLLSGLSAEEVVHIKRESLDFSTGNIVVATGESPRSVAMNGAVRTLFEHIEPCPVWDKGRKVSLKTLDSILNYAIVDAGLTGESGINTNAISEAYIRYLVKQGVRLSELDQVTGEIDPTDLSRFSSDSPAGKGVPISDINLLYPALIKYID
ncbi:MAG: integrase [Methyloprofundus sp.]|nr:integrase [Methyloprofundus sp.]